MNVYYKILHTIEIKLCRYRLNKCHKSGAQVVSNFFSGFNDVMWEKIFAEKENLFHSLLSKTA